MLKILPLQSRIDCHRGTLSFLLVLWVAVQAFAGPSPADTADTTLSDSLSSFYQRILFPKSSSVISYDFADNRIHLDSIRAFLSDSADRKLECVNIIGSYSPEGRYAFNTKLANARARALEDFARKFNPEITTKTSVAVPADKGSSQFRLQRFAELQILYRTTHADKNICKSADTVALHSEPVQTPVLPADNCNEVQSANDTALNVSASNDNEAQSNKAISLHNPKKSPAGRLFIATNMLYDAALTPNIGVGILISDRFTLFADWMYARWNNRDNRKYWRIYGGDIEIKYHIGAIRGNSPLGGHHIGAYASLACYDFQLNRNHRGFLSDKYNYAAGLSYTYSLPVNKRINIDFNIGIGYLWGKYKKHTPIDDCDVWLSTHKLGWFGPTKVGVSFVWLIGNSVANR